MTSNTLFHIVALLVAVLVVSEGLAAAQNQAWNEYGTVVMATNDPVDQEELEDLELDYDDRIEDARGCFDDLNGMQFTMPTFNWATFKPGMPTFNPGMPTFNHEVPTFNHEVPIFKPGMPTFNPGMPTFNHEVPTFKPGMPTFNHKVPTFKPDADFFGDNFMNNQEMNGGSPMQSSISLDVGGTNIFSYGSSAMLNIQAEQDDLRLKVTFKGSQLSPDCKVSHIEVNRYGDMTFPAETSETYCGETPLPKEIISDANKMGIKFITDGSGDILKGIATAIA